MKRLSRLAALFICAVLAFKTGHAEQAAGPSDSGYSVAVCDWMILKRQKLGAFKLAREVGADGVEVDMGGLGNRPTFDSKLGDPATRAQFAAEAEKYRLHISSIAMSGFYSQSFAEREGVERTVQDAIDTAVALHVRVLFLPLGVQSDLVKRPELRPRVVQRLRTIGRQAEAAGVVVGIESALDAKAEAALLDEVASPAIKSYFNISNALQNGRDIHAELRALGRERIVQIHASNTDGHWLEKDPQVDLPAIRRTLDEMGWRGWLVIERSRDGARATDVRYNFTANVAYLHRIFGRSEPAR